MTRKERVKRALEHKETVVTEAVERERAIKIVQKAIERYGVSYNQICGWVKKYEKDGSDGLIDRRGKRKDERAMTEVEKLRLALKLKDAENYRLQMENDLLKKLKEIERG